jgi:predicted RecB family nuclease
MRMSGSAVELSASDLSGSLSCTHLTALDLAVAKGLREPSTWVDLSVIALRERGLDHERRYVEQLISDGLRVEDLSGTSNEEAVAASVEAMRRGVDVIVQPALRNGRWFGRPDVLRRSEERSALGGWSYHVVDTKLAKETRGGTILQLSLYSELLGLIQETVPEYFEVVTPGPVTPIVHPFRINDFDAYFRMIRQRLETVSLLDPLRLAEQHYPEPIEYCEICRWDRICKEKRRHDDHLSLVAGMGRLQSRQLEAAGIRTLAQLGQLTGSLPFKPKRGAEETYIRLREQARVQLEGRIKRKLVHELLKPIEAGHGLARLPAPSAGDTFLDLEGARFARYGGRQYLFGYVILDATGSSKNHSRWAYSDSEERVAFEGVVDDILLSWQSNPGMHVYHYAHYEPTAFKSLMARYATREAEIDRMLRADLFIDLHAVVKRGIRASVEDYSIKKLEPFYGFSRDVNLEEANVNLRVLERALELGATSDITPAVRAAVAGYNLDDCRSALKLRDWLEELRASVEAHGTEVPRPELREGAPSRPINDRAKRVEGIFRALLDGIPTERAERNDEQQAQWLLAHLLDYHRREEKTPWWEFFRLRGSRCRGAALRGPHQYHQERYPHRPIQLPSSNNRATATRSALPPGGKKIRDSRSYRPSGANIGRQETRGSR